MLVKLGVSVARMARPIRRSLNIIDAVFREFHQEPVLTSTTEGTHSPSSLHYDEIETGAVDIRRPRKYLNEIVARLREELGDDFDIVVEATHIHVEYDPK